MAKSKGRVAPRAACSSPRRVRAPSLVQSLRGIAHPSVSCRTCLEGPGRRWLSLASMPRMTFFEALHIML